MSLRLEGQTMHSVYARPQGNDLAKKRSVALVVVAGGALSLIVLFTMLLIVTGGFQNLVDPAGATLSFSALLGPSIVAIGVGLLAAGFFEYRRRSQLRQQPILVETEMQ